VLDIKLIREDPQAVKVRLKLRGENVQLIDEILLLDKERRGIIQKSEQLKNLRNTVSEEIAKMKKEKKDASVKIFEMKRVSDEIKSLDGKLNQFDNEINNILYNIPNLPHESVPKGKSPEENVQIKISGDKPDISDSPPLPRRGGQGGEVFLDHIQLGKKFDILDFETGTKISGSGFPFYKGKGAILERALINFMLDTHRQNGYTEVFTPFIVNRASMEATEKLPKFAEDMYRGFKFCRKQTIRHRNVVAGRKKMARSIERQ